MKSSMFLRFAVGTPMPAASLEWRRVDGRDKPGHDEGIRGAAELGQPTGSAIRAIFSFVSERGFSKDYLLIQIKNGPP